MNTAEANRALGVLIARLGLVQADADSLFLGASGTLAESRGIVTKSPVFVVLGERLERLTRRGADLVVDLRIRLNFELCHAQFPLILGGNPGKVIEVHITSRVLRA